MIIAYLNAFVVYFSQHILLFTKKTSGFNPLVQLYFIAELVQTCLNSRSNKSHFGNDLGRLN